MSRHADDPRLFTSVERRIALLRTRLEDFPSEHATLTRLIAHLHKRIQDIYHAVLKPSGLNYTSFTTLMMMYGTEDYSVTPSDLAAATGEKPTNITRICDDLLAKGLIDRTPSLDDRRRIDITLTRRGKQLVEKLQPPLREALRKVYGSFSAGDLRQLNGLLRKQLSNVEHDA